jgi:two-component system, cell cycle sensor histidine kinase and response regulator CckA
MSEPGCDRQVREAQRRLDELTDRVGRIAEHQPLVGETMGELSTALQELRAAADELQQQNEELAETRELVEEERRRYQELFDDAPDGYLVTDPKGTIQQANEVAASLLGVRRDLLPGKPFVVFVASDAHRAFASYLARLHDGYPERVAEWQTSVQPRGGPPFPVTLTTGRIRDRKGRLVGLRWLLRDSTERVRTEVARRQWEAHLQHTQRLESLGVLAGGIAHDFNNLLTGVLGSAELALLRLPADTSARAEIEQIITAAHRAADLTGQMLAYSGRGTFRVQPIQLSVLIREMDMLLRASVPKTCALDFHLGEPLPAIEADATQLRQVLMNLVVNAGEAIGGTAGVITVRVGVRQCDRAYLAGGVLDKHIPEGPYVSLEVTDTGCGMSGETQARMFEPFFTTKFTGRGLGLAAVQGIVRGHHGTILVTSELGRGTRIEALFPPTKRPVIAPQVSAPVPPAWRGEGTILVVDDEAYIRSGAAEALRHSGFTVLTAADGQEAVGVFREHAETIRAVLLDLTMPNMDGAATMIQLRQIRPDVRVVLSSGYTEEEATRQFTNRDLVGFLQKPYALKDLIASVRGALEPVDR